ncbi:MAG: DNA polymerase III subunit beta [Clostridiales bacterium]|nr:DNA polymerase III subunit beta [Clostridiales bacterium]
MKFTCSQGALARALNTVSKAVSIRTTIPILKGILLTVKDNELTMTASDLDLSIETKLDVQSIEDGRAVVNSKLFSEIIRKLPNAVVKMEEEDGKMEIACLGSNFSIVSLPADEFPAIGMVNQLNKIEINKDILKDLIKKTTFAASIDEKKGILVGCLLKFYENKLEVAALDGFRLAVANAEVGAEEERSVVIPARILMEIQKILMESSEEEAVSLVLDNKKAEIITKETRIVARLLEGEFIKYNDIIPKTYKTRCIVNREEMLSGIERASLLAKEGKNNLIRLDVSGSRIIITSRSEEGNSKEVISTECEGEDLIIGFNSKYVSDVLKAVNDEEVVLEMSSPVSPCLIKPLEGDSYVYLVLPVRISVN